VLTSRRSWVAQRLRGNGMRRVNITEREIRAAWKTLRAASIGAAIPFNKKGRAGVAAIRAKATATSGVPRESVPAGWRFQDVDKELGEYLKGIEKRETPNRKVNAWRPQEEPTTLCGGGKWIVKFLRLKDSEEEAKQFQKEHRTYFPPEFWNLKLPPDGELYAGSVMVRLRPGGVVPHSVSIEQPVPRSYFWQGYRDLLRAAWEHRFGDEYIPRLLNLPTVNPDSHAEDYIKDNLAKLPPSNSKAGLHPFQHDILALFRAPWRVRNCQECGQPFVPNKGCRRCCSKDCSTKAELARKRKWAKRQRRAKKRKPSK
jgi:hypothetical protein